MAAAMYSSWLLLSVTDPLVRRLAVTLVVSKYGAL
jgi:hypothetical protein